MSPKDKKIIEDSIHDNIPVFVLTAKDSKSLRTIKWYLFQCLEECDNEFIKAVEKRIHEFNNWQTNNKDKVKLPD